MLFVNQNDYAHMKYPTHMELPDHPSHNNSVKDAGCGLCSACMMVDRLTTQVLPLEECRDMAMECKANHDSGTNMEVFAPVLAERFALSYEATDNMEALKACLREGGCAILNPGGDQEDGYIGVFTHGGHYIVAISERNGEFCILDPNLSDDKFQSEGRVGKVRVDGPFVYASEALLIKETDNRSPRYYLFRRKSDQ